jgi:transcriptional regulator with XRE-family HTH domain
MKQQHLSQKLLAEKVGVTESAMSLYVRDKRTPRSDVLARIARALGVASDHLLGINDAVNNDEDRLSYLQRKLGKLDEAQLEKAETVLKAVFDGIFDDAFTAPKGNKFCIEIAGDLTNGDVIKAVLGEPAIEGKKGILYKFKYRNGKTMFSTYFDIEWWNAPYRKEGIKDGRKDIGK